MFDLLFLLQYFRGIQECAVEQEMIERREITMTPVKQSMNDELVSHYHI